MAATFAIFSSGASHRSAAFTACPQGYQPAVLRLGQDRGRNLLARFNGGIQRKLNPTIKSTVSFAEAATVFFDPISITVPDPLHSVDENGFVITGLSYQQRIWSWCTRIEVIEYESLVPA